MVVVCPLCQVVNPPVFVQSVLSWFVQLLRPRTQQRVKVRSSPQRNQQSEIGDKNMLHERYMHCKRRPAF